MDAREFCAGKIKNMNEGSRLRTQVRETCYADQVPPLLPESRDYLLFDLLYDLSIRVLNYDGEKCFIAV